MIMPHVTQIYSDSKDPDEKNIPMCTLRNFPNIIEHCIEWGRAKFNDFFTDEPADCRGYLEDPEDFLKRAETDNSAKTIERLEAIVKLINIKQTGKYEECVRLAKTWFNNFYDYNIRNLTMSYPKDTKTDAGIPFWSGTKRFPNIIGFDGSNPDH
jgi:ubiquitin-activating enzyme E1